MKNFKITDEHIKLLGRLCIDWDGDCYEGAPTCNIKRPYGNSSGVVYDIGELLGWVFPYSEDEECKQPTDEQRNKASLLHESMQHVLQIICATGQVSTGIYALKCEYDRTSWYKV